MVIQVTELYVEQNSLLFISSVPTQLDVYIK